MCWNEDVSLNTFLFSGFALIIIMYNNAFTKYKIPELNDKWVYLLLMSFIFMQLVEFFIWRNLNNKFYNNLFTSVACLLILIQPLFSIMIIKNIQIRNILLLLLLLFLIWAFSIISFTLSFSDTDDGHLSWFFFKAPQLFFIIWFLFPMFSLFYEQKWTILFFLSVTIIIAMLSYKDRGTVGSFWCWAVNSIMIYYIIYLVLFLPFLEKKMIC